VAQGHGRLPWRRKIASLNYLLASHVWRQDHNGFTHQDPVHRSNVVNKKAEVVRVYFLRTPNCLLSVMDHCTAQPHYVNVVVGGGSTRPQWLDHGRGRPALRRGIGIWQWASNDQACAPDVVMACCGDVPTLETLAAVSIIRRELPDLKVRVVNVVNLMKLQPPSEHPHGLSEAEFDELFTRDKPVIFAFHGYPWLIHTADLPPGQPRQCPRPRLQGRGHHHHALRHDGPQRYGPLPSRDGRHRPPAADRPEGRELKQRLRGKLIEHRQHIEQHGEDLPEIRRLEIGARSNELKAVIASSRTGV
jgi:xylulose-5-phosphate/fructose-6-phosphate phosphoketolase